MSKKIKYVNPLGSDFDEHMEDELKDPATAAYYINAAVEEHDASYLTVALGKVVRIHGVKGIAKLGGLNRESIYKMLSPEGNPAFKNIVEILNACGLEITVQPKGQAPGAVRETNSGYVHKSDLDGIIRDTVVATVREYARAFTSTVKRAAKRGS